jgi:hypothetical protein
VGLKHRRGFLGNAQEVVYRFSLPQDYSKTRGVIARRETPWTSDTTNQALRSEKQKENP